jgi:DNA polymerase-3 subunit gamma/tau
MAEYIVTARKWRPIRFEEVAGQSHVTVTLRNAISSGRLAHAYLFSGPRGVGKTTTARLLAKALNCASPVDNNPDNECESCREITEGRSFDVLEIDGASNRGVEEIRNLRESVRYAPTKGRYKVYIIDEVHMLTKEAFNALLKTLEEPPPSVLFIFATTEVHKVPATIQSRCQRFDFRRISIDQIMANLREIARQEQLAIDDNALLLIARKGDGSLRDAQSLFDQVVSLCGRDITLKQILDALNIVDQEVYFRVTDLLKTRDAQGALALVQELVSNGHDLRDFVSGLLEHFRNLLVVRATGSAALVETSDVYRKRYEQEAGHFSATDLLRYQRFVGGTESSLRYATQPRFKLEADMVQLVLLPGAADVGDLLERLDELKKKAGEVGTDAPLAAADRPTVGQPGTPPTRVAPSPVAQSPAAPVAVPHEPVVLSPAPQSAPASSPVEQSAAGRPRAAALISENEVRTRWGEYVAAVRKQKISLASVLESSWLAGIGGNIVRFGCENEYQSVTVSRSRELLQSVFEQVFHATVRVEAEVAQDVAPRTDPAAAPAASVRPPAPAADNPILEVLRRELGAEPLG